MLKKIFILGIISCNLIGCTYSEIKVPPVVNDKEVPQNYDDIEFEK